VNPPKKQAHDEEEAARVGDDVRIAQCAPVSRHKHFVLTEIIRRGSSR
jgi:ribosomal protein S17